MVCHGAALGGIHILGTTEYTCAVPRLWGVDDFRLPDIPPPTSKWCQSRYHLLQAAGKPALTDPPGL